MTVSIQQIQRSIDEMDDESLLRRWHRHEFSREASEIAEREIARRNLSLDRPSWVAAEDKHIEAVNGWEDSKDCRAMKRLLYSAAAASGLPQTIRDLGVYERFAILIASALLIASAVLIPQITTKYISSRPLRYILSIGYVFFILGISVWFVQLFKP